ncbi:MAG TPA: glycosyltransferase family 39 protein [Anaerolineales bacterium]|nr:glycosyltransferase family 39 protein [Anaerolineales bacterium]
MTDNQLQDQPPFDEPSVLDYFKSLFRFGGEGTAFSDEQGAVDEQQLAQSEQPSTVIAQTEKSELQIIDPQSTEEPQPSTFNPQPATEFPWRSLLALLFALIGQNTYEPPPTTSPLGIAFYITAFGLLGWAIYRGEWTLEAHRPSSKDEIPATVTIDMPMLVRGVILLFGILLAFVGFGLFRNNQFTMVNVSVWLVSISCIVGALWERKDGSSLLGWLKFSFNTWTLLLLAATLLVFFFRFYQTGSVPPEPFSDHAEKILDVYEVSQGQTRIFFPRNTGREAFQMYWTLLIERVFNTGFSYLSLKLGTAILGFLTLPFVYLLGKEIGGRRVGLFAFIMTGIGYWPNVISRVGLRFPLFPLFAAPTLFFLVRGLRTRNRNDFLLSGLLLGIGLHGYSPMRIIPFVVIAAFVIYWLHAQSKGARRILPAWLAALGFTSLIVFLPLLRYWYDEPQLFGFRAVSRLSGTEQALPGPAYQVFFSNLWNALRMFNFDDGEIWVHSVPHRPALDVVTAALFALGVILILVRYARKRHWLDLFLLVSIPLLQLPSILSLAFPGENPALNRAGAAYIPAFVIGAMALDGLLTSFGRGRIRNVLIWGMTGLLLLISANQNYDLVFDQYAGSFEQGSWNSSDMGQVIKDFERDYGRTDTVWIVPYPHWVDTRLPAVWAGIPNRDMAVWRDDLPTTLELTGPKLFIVRANIEDPQFDDVETLYALKTLYPNGEQRLFDSEVTGHDFWIYFVPSE